MNRDALRRVIAVINGKGGVGKTTCTANLGGLLAASGWRVLLVDLDSQGNLGLDLGYRGTEKDDDGVELSKAIVYGGVPEPVRQIRPNLDVLVGGSHLESATAALVSRTGQGKIGDARLSVARALEQIADDYDVVLMDCPPQNDTIQSAAVAAARYVLIPVKTDPASLEGLDITAARLDAVYDLNPTIDLLGVIVFASGSGATSVRSGFTKTIIETLGGGAPAEAALFPTFIRHSEATASATRSSGKLVHELDDAVRQGPKWYEFLKRGEKPTNIGPRSASSVADDFQSLASEVATRITERESAEEAAHV